MGGVGLGGGQGGCERRIEVSKKKFFFLGGVGGGVWVGLRGESGCERRIEVFVKIQKKKFGEGVGGGGLVGGRGGGLEWM